MVFSPLAHGLIERKLMSLIQNTFFTPAFDLLISMPFSGESLKVLKPEITDQ